MTRFWDGQTDGVTQLLDLLSHLATQVKKTKRVQFFTVTTAFFNFFMDAFNVVAYMDGLL